ncbi:MAG: hypothetical protein AB7S75_01695 [Desulfococcaceae bacterium]
MDNNALTDKKKKVAALAAVTAYIKSQQEMMAMQAAPPSALAEVPKPAAMPSLWGVSGRMDIMQMRNMMQMKSFHGVKFR